ncbi:hypothetical protein RND81_06G172400 [Saponaria officinalis]|uniref:IBH1-like N-terminal domain-containing protein n=1 Tax=Saponaria officinalis TaxID=3572 RepID=A0AAW1KCN0_SAPOF
MQYYQDSLKKEFLKKWIKCLQSFTPSKMNNMTFIQRKKVIKFSSNLAMASTRNSTRSWNNAFISKAYEDEETRDLANKIPRRFDETNWPLSSKDKLRTRNFLRGTSKNNYKNVISKKIGNFRKIVPRKIGPFNSIKVNSRAIAKRLVKKRVEILKGLIPGGECMDECCLIKETLNYIVSLRAQVDVMHYLVNNCC